MPTITKLCSIQEVAQHNTREDCWVVVDGKIYDVTDYLDEHPGGDDVLLSATGKDATDDFEDAGHSQSARDLMKQFFVGELDPSPPPPVIVIPELEIINKKQPTDINKLLKNVTLQYWPIPAAVLGIAAVLGLLYTRRKE